MNKVYIFTSALLLLNGSVTQTTDIFYEISKGNLSKNTENWLKNSENKNMVNAKGQTILHHAVLTGNIQIIKKVANSNVDVNALDKAGKTALDYAVDHGNKNIIQYLLMKKASVTTEQNALFAKELIKPSTLYKIGIALVVIGVICLIAPLIVAIYIPLAGWLVLASLGEFTIFGVPGIVLMVTNAPRNPESLIISAQPA
ncbi:MAG TPA: ankyrin repeat domain-containing protein [Candidatus Saccharimonadales bacterium]|nr:ankyrin repeat domain-containing protein [Candidatus Saccharimonadales bacterium]